MKRIISIITPIIILCCTFFVMENASAAGVWIDKFGARVDNWNNYQCNQTYYQDGYLYNQNFYGCHLTGIQVTSQNVQATGNALMWSGKLNIVKKLDWVNVNDFYSQQEFNFIGATFGGVELNIENIATNYWVTSWGEFPNNRYQTLTIAWTMTATARQSIDGQTAKLSVAIFPRNHNAFDQIVQANTDNVYYFENNGEAMEIFFTKNGLEGLDQLVQQNQAIQMQNQTMINQNNQIISNMDEINKSITDSNVSGNFNTSPIQPFGPVGQITTAVLELPRVVLNINSCQTIKPRLPFVNKDMDIPCPSVILNNMAGDLITFIDVIISAGIWFVTARYIFRKVQQLRDPTNEDEEYLDI